MTRKRILIRLVIWAAVFVAHYFGVWWAIDYVFDRGPKWLDYVIEYSLFWPGNILRRFGLRVFRHQVGPRVLHSVIWTATVAVLVTGSRWLWGVRPSRPRASEPRKLGAGPDAPDSSCPPPGRAV